MPCDLSPTQSRWAFWCLLHSIERVDMKVNEEKVCRGLTNFQFRMRRSVLYVLPPTGIRPVNTSLASQNTSSWQRLGVVSTHTGVSIL